MIALRIVTHGVVGVLAILIGLSVGSLFWELRGLILPVNSRRTSPSTSIGSPDWSAVPRGLEARVCQDVEARRVLEDELHRVRPQK